MKLTGTLAALVAAQILLAPFTSTATALRMPGDIPAPTQAADDKPPEPEAGPPAYEIEPTYSETDDSDHKPSSAPAVTDTGNSERDDPPNADESRSLSRGDEQTDVDGQQSASLGPEERSASQDEMATMWAVAIVALVVAFVLVWIVAHRTSQRYGWPIILNGWNLLYVVGIVGGMFLGSISPGFGYGLFAICWLAMLVLNIVKTDFLTGLLATVVQPVALLSIIFVVMMVTARPKQVTLD